MSYGDIISIVSNSASRTFNEKIDGRRIHDSLKSANTAPVISIQLKNLSNSQSFCKMDKLKYLQWNCRGLNNKISDLILFFAEKDIDVIC